MALQEQNSSPQSNVTNPSSSLNAHGLGSVTGPQLDEQFSHNDYTPKVRKPYTITKQRERWTEEEHKKFLEALKLYGRAWRRLEEHVGTKTAVQIRSHAQKFFTKVVRDSSDDNTINSDDAIVIPPPRPKRKPMHPYPRKILHPLGKKSLTLDHPLRSSSQDFSGLDQENQSPTSVLSAVHSGFLGSVDSNTQNRSLSPVSATPGVCGPGYTLEPSSLPEDSRSVSPMRVMPASGAEEPLPKLQNFDLFPDEQSPSKDLLEEPSIQTLKLFGRTLLVTKHTILSPPGKEKHTQPLLQSVHENWTRSHLPEGPPGTLSYMQLGDNNNNPGFLAADSATPMPWTFCGGVPFPIVPFHNKDPSEAHKEVRDKEINKEGSWTGSDYGSVNNGDNKNTEPEMGSWMNALEDKYLSVECESKPRLRIDAGGKTTKGFVPYKRTIAERESQCSIITGEEREVQRIRFCL